MIEFIRLSNSDNDASFVTFIRTTMFLSSGDGRYVVRLLRDGVLKKQYVSEQKRRQGHHVAPKESRRIRPSIYAFTPESRIPSSTRTNSRRRSHHVYAMLFQNKLAVAGASLADCRERHQNVCARLTDASEHRRTLISLSTHLSFMESKTAGVSLRW